MNSQFFDVSQFENAWIIICEEFPMATWETVYVTFLATAFAIIIGLPLGAYMYIHASSGIYNTISALYKTIDFVLNVIRSIPFLILMVLVFPLTRLIVGTAIGTNATIVPLVISAFPFIARLSESSFRETDPNTIEMARSLGASPFQIVIHVLLPESTPSLISNYTVAVATILGFSAMSGFIGGGGLGRIAMNYGYYRYQYVVMTFAVIVIVFLVQIIQSAGTRLAMILDKRIKSTNFSK